MLECDVLVIGRGISGAVTALMLANEGIKVILVGSDTDEDSVDSYPSLEGIPVISDTDQIRLLKDESRCSRAIEQLVDMGPRCIHEFLLRDLSIHFDRDQQGNLIYYGTDPSMLRVKDGVGKNMIKALNHRLSQNPAIQILPDHIAIELLTLEDHSTKEADTYKKPACLGAHLYDQVSQEVVACLAKETVVATGGIGGLYRYTTHSEEAVGSGIAMAHRAGARVINLCKIHFCPSRFQEKTHSFGPVDYDGRTVESFYQTLIQGKKLHISMESASKSVIPAADFIIGGIAVDKYGQTSIQRLRAVGRTACTGVHGRSFERSIALLESLVWAISCAEDIAKQVRKYVYYFPPVKPYKNHFENYDDLILEQDFHTVRQTMWDYAGVMTNWDRLNRAKSIMNEISQNVERTFGSAKLSKRLIDLRHALYTARLVIDALYAQTTSREQNFSNSNFELEPSLEIHS